MIVQQAARCAVAGILVILFAFLAGCVAQESDLRQTKRDLQQRIKQQDDQFSQSRARQSQEISSLRDQELPQLRGEIEKTSHQTQDLRAKQEDLHHRTVQLEQQAKKLEQLVAKLETDSGTRHAWVQKSLDNQEAKVAARLDELTKAMEAAMATLKKDIVEVVQRTNETLAKRVDLKLEDQQKGFLDNQHRLEQMSQKFGQFNQAMTGFKEALTELHDRVGQEEQTTKDLTARIESDAKTASAHAMEVNKSVVSVAKALESVGEKVTSRFDDQDRRIEGLTRTVEQLNQKPGPRQQPAKQTKGKVAPSNQEAQSESPEPAGGAHASVQKAAENISATTVVVTAPPETSVPSPSQRDAESADRASYDRVLALFREGDLENARRGFTEFLLRYPNSDLAPNARYWQGESYYGRKDFHKAIDAYDRVELDYPGSEKVPAALLKKGYAYLALKDKKRASSAFKQVVTLYPKSPEAGKASDKLAQLKEAK